MINIRRAVVALGLVLGVGVVTSLAWSGVSHAADIRSGESVVLAANETVNNSVYAAGNSVTIAGTVKGDVFCAGSNIEVTGTVEGDVICAGQSIRIGGKVQGDVRVGGQNIDIHAAITGSVTTFGESVVLGTEAVVERDLTLAGSQVHIAGTIGRDVLGGADSLVVTGTIGRHVDAQITTLRLGATAKVNGNLTYSSPAPATIADGAKVAGETHYTAMAAKGNAAGLTPRLWVALYGLIALLIVGLAWLLVAPRTLDTLGVTLSKRPALSFASGAALLLLTPVITVLLFVTLFGIPLALLVLMSLGIGLLSALVIGGYAFGGLVVEKLKRPVRGRRLISLVVGLLCLTAVWLIPLLGLVVIFLLLLCGLGAIGVAIASKLYPPSVSKKKKAGVA